MKGTTSTAQPPTTPSISIILHKIKLSSHNRVLRLTSLISYW